MEEEETAGASASPPHDSAVFERLSRLGDVLPRARRGSAHTGAVLRSPPILRFRMIPRFQLERVAIECATPARMYEPRPTR